MKNTTWLAVFLIAGGVAVILYWQLQRQPEAPPPPPAVAEAPPAARIEPPPIRHPVQAAPPGEKPLPPLEASDPAMQEALVNFFGKKPVETFFDLKDIVRRFVVTVDNLPRAKLPPRYQLFHPVAGKFLVSGAEETLAIHPGNYRRYFSYVLLAEAVDSKKLVAVYVRFYPLFQQEYQNLGYPKGYFNDRLVEAIDDLLAAPEPKGPIRLTQPKVLYQFADPELEALSAGQKIMVRMGPENAARIKARLREVRHELTRQAPKS